MADRYDMRSHRSKSANAKTLLYCDRLIFGGMLVSSCHVTGASHFVQIICILEQNLCFDVYPACGYKGPLYLMRYQAHHDIN
jgi:hypothetical protein